MSRVYDSSYLDAEKLRCGECGKPIGYYHTEGQQGPPHAVTPRRGDEMSKVLTVKDLVTVLIDSKGPVEKFAVVLDPGDGEPMVALASARFDHEVKALILEKE